MTPTKFQYITPQEERTTISISKELMLILRMYAKERGLTTGTMHYLALREGLAGLNKKGNERR